jgi:hypothetical protein
METFDFSVLAALYSLEEPILGRGDRSALAKLSHNFEDVLKEVNLRQECATVEDVIGALRSLWINGQIIAWTTENIELPINVTLPADLTISPITKNRTALSSISDPKIFSAAYCREIDDSPVQKRLYRSRISETIRMLAFNRQRFDLIPSTSAFTYMRKERKRPRRDVSINNAIKELSEIEGLSENKIKSISIVLNALSHQVGDHIARFQIEATRAALSEASSSKPLAIVAGVSSGKTIAFALPLLVNAVDRSLNGQGGRVRALFVYPRATLVEDQFQRIQTWSVKINEYYGSQLLHGPALDAAGKLPQQVSPAKRINIIDALRLAFPRGNKSHEFVFTTIETLKNRLQNPFAISAYVSDLDGIVFDEAHLLEGLQGAHTTNLIKRISSIRRGLKKPPISLRIAASATMAEPDDHVGKLYGTDRADIIVRRPLDEDSETFSSFHHVFLRTGKGQSTLSAITNGVSCLIHNRSDGLAREYYEDGQINQWGERADLDTQSIKPTKGLKKTIGFVDSLSTIGSWSFTVDDNEGAIFTNKGTGEFAASKDRRYPYFTWFSEPLWKIPARNGEEKLAEKMRPICQACKAGRSVSKTASILRDNFEVFQNIKTGPRSSTPSMPFDLFGNETDQVGSLQLCPFFNHGLCWWFSQDDETQTKWLPSNLYGGTEAEKREYQEDASITSTFVGQIRTQSLTSYQGLDSDKLLNDVNDLFRQPAASIFRFVGRRFAKLRRRLNGLKVDGAPEFTSSWRENYSFLLASPKIEVGVDFDNVRDGILHRAIRNVASYQQKSGRVGRESNSDSMIVTFMSQSPIDFHYYRNPTNLVDPDHLDAVPLKTKNLDVLRCHLFLCCFDFFAIGGSELMLIRGPKQLVENGEIDAVNFDQTVKSTVFKLGNERDRLRNYLRSFASGFDEVNVDEAIDKFERVLRVLNFPINELNSETDPKFTFASLIQRRERIQLGGQFSDLRTKFAELNEKIRECERSFIPERHDIGVFSKLRMIRRHLENANIDELSETFSKVKPQYSQMQEKILDLDCDPDDHTYYSHASRFIQVTHTILKIFEDLPSETEMACAFVTISSDYNSSIDKAISNNTQIPEFFYLNDLLPKLKFFLSQYPYILPQSFFEHPKSERVAVTLANQSNDVEFIPRPTVLYDLLPGSWTYRFGDAMKSPSGRIELLSNREVGLIDLSRMRTAGFEAIPLQVPLSQEDLPEDFPPELRESSVEIEILAPTTVRLARSPDRVRVGRATGIVNDDDEATRDHDDDEEYDSHTEGRSVRTQTLPRTMPRFWFKIDDETSSFDDMPFAFEHPLVAVLLESAKVTSELRVTQFCYGITRTYSADVDPPSLFYTNSGRSVCLGDQMITDGIVLTLSPDLIDDVLNEVLIGSNSIKGTLIRTAFSGFLSKVCGAPHFTGSRIRESLSRRYAEEYGSLSLDLKNLAALIKKISIDEFKHLIVDCEITKYLGSNEHEMDAANERAKRYIDESVDYLLVLKEKIELFDEGFLRDWTTDTLVHSVALKIYQAACRSSGSSSDQLGYFYRANQKDSKECKVYLFDKIEGGSGLCDIISKNFFISSNRRSQNDQFATTDFLSEWVKNMGTCPSHLVQILCDLEASTGRAVDTPRHLKSIQSDLIHCRNTLDAPTILRWLHQNSSVSLEPGNLDQLNVALDAAALFLPKLVEDGVIPKDGAYHRFERAITGCIDGCPECVIDTGNSIYGPFLTADHTDNRLSTLFLDIAGRRLDRPSVCFGRTESEIRALKFGVDECEGTTLTGMSEWISSADVQLDGTAVELEMGFLFDLTN